MIKLLLVVSVFLHEQIVVSADGLFFEYHDRVSITQWNVNQQYPPLYSGYIDDYPEELSKKITLIKYFRSNFIDRVSTRDLRKEEIEDSAKGGPKQNMPFVVKWLIKEGGSICLLSTGAILVRYEGGTIFNLESPFDDVTFLDKFGIVSSMTLAKAVSSGRDDIQRRLAFITNNITDIVTRLSRNARGQIIILEELFVFIIPFLLSSFWFRWLLTGSLYLVITVSTAISGVQTTRSYDRFCLPQILEYSKA